MKLLLRWAIVAFAIFVAARFVPGIEVDTANPVLTYLLLAVVLGLVNALIRPVLLLLTCPLQLLTLGLFTLVVNAVCFWLAGQASQVLDLGLRVEGFLPAFLGSVVVSVVSMVLSALLADDKRR